VARAPSKPLLIYDGDCGFCKRWIQRWQSMTGEAVDYLPFQDESIPARFPEIPREDFEQAVQLVTPAGTVYSGASGVLRALAVARRERWLLWLYLRLPIFTFAADLIYHEAAMHRAFLSRVDRAVYGGRAEWPEYRIVRYIFLRGLALIYLAAFASLAMQVHGLIGHEGIAPADRLIAAGQQYVKEHHVGVVARVWDMPTVAWLGAGDRALTWMCGSGMALSVTLLFGIAPAPVLFLLWLEYLSLCTIGAPFLDFQWDLLLLETGFLAIFLAPLQWFEKPRRQPGPSRAAIWLLRWLIFRLMLESGCVKLMSGDTAWWDLSALKYHFQTQPLPTWLAWHASHLSAGWLRAAKAGMFLIELAGPALIFAGRRFRLMAAGLFAFLQAVILLTGNYTFFNWLTILLCVPLLDDEAALWLARRKRRTPREDEGRAVAPVGAARWPSFITAPMFVFVVLMTSVPLFADLGVGSIWPRLVTEFYLFARPLRSFNGYGLFAVMTRTRAEIVLQGSDDGVSWRDYEFKYKPGALNARPEFVAPFQPRLDWQMWFAVFYPAQDPRNRWFLEFMLRLLQNSKPVRALLKTDPFAPNAPKFIRAQIYNYRFTTEAERKATGDWWARTPLGLYLPPVSLRSFQASQPD